MYLLCIVMPKTNERCGKKFRGPCRSVLNARENKKKRNFLAPGTRTGKSGRGFAGKSSTGKVSRKKKDGPGEKK